MNHKPKLLLSENIHDFVIFVILWQKQGQILPQYGWLIPKYMRKKKM